MIRLEHEVNNERTELARCKTIAEAFKKLDEYLLKINYTSLYKRISTVTVAGTLNTELRIDYGPWNKFAYISGYSKDELEEWRKK